jgi:3'-5' exoribonuclease
MGKEPTSIHKDHRWIRDIEEDESIDGLYLAKTKRVSLTRNGDPYLSLTLSDRTGDVEARVWDRADALASGFREGDVLDVKGRASSYRGRVQLVLTDLKPVDPGDVDPGVFLEETDKDTGRMLSSLRSLLREIRNPHLKSLTDRFLNDRGFMARFKRAPAAKAFHHAYLGGLLEHTLSVCEMAAVVSGQYPELDRDLLMAGAFLHDIGKIREFEYRLRIDYSDAGRLLGHLALGTTMLDEKTAGLKDFPKGLELRLKHLILSHHGEYAFGSPKRPKFLEAIVLHLIDDLDAKINGVGRFMERDQQGGDWTEFNRLFERYFLKAGLEPEEAPVSTAVHNDEKQNVLFPSAETTVGQGKP